MINPYVKTGLTARGKTKFTVHLAKVNNGAIHSTDSRKGYKKMDT